MGDNIIPIDNMKGTVNVVDDVTSTNILNVNSQDVNTTLNTKSSSNSLEPQKSLNKTPSFNSEISTKSSKSSKSDKSKSKKRSKVKNMIRMIEKRIINPKKEVKDDTSFSLSEVNEGNSHIDYIEKEPQVLVVEELVTEKDNNNENIHKVTETVEIIEEIIEVEEEKEVVNDISSLPKKEENIIETEVPILEEKEKTNDGENKENINNEKSKESIDEKVEENKEIEETSENIEEVVEDKKIDEMTENVEEVAEIKEERVNENVEVKEEIHEILEETNEESKEKINEEVEVKEEENHEFVEETKEDVEAKEDINDVIEETKEDVEAKEDIKEVIEETKEDVEAKEDIKEVIEETKENIEVKEEDIKEFIEETKEDVEVKEEDIKEVIEETKEDVEVKEEDIKEVIEETSEDVEVNESNNEVKEEIYNENNSCNDGVKDSIITQLSQVINNSDQESSVSEQGTSLLSAEQMEQREEKDQTNKQISEEMMQALIQAKEDEYKAYVDEEVRVEDPSDVEEVVVVEESDNYPVSQDDQSINQQNVSDMKSGDNYGQPLKAEIIDLSNESSVSNESVEEVKQEQKQEQEMVKDTSFSDEGAVAEELNDFTNALKSINDINNAEKQFLIPNAEVMEKMINKSLQSNKNKDTLDISVSNATRNSLEVMENTSSNRSSNQSSSNLHLQILPPQPPPAAPLPPTPHGTLPPQSFFESDDDDMQSTSSSEGRKAHLQHYSLGRLTEIINEEEEEEEAIQSAKHNSIKTDNSVPLNSNVQTVTIQDVNSTDDNEEIKSSIQNNSQPLQADVFKIDSEDSLEYSNVNNEQSMLDQPEEVSQIVHQEQEEKQEQEEEPESEQLRLTEQLQVPSPPTQTNLPPQSQSQSQLQSQPQPQPQPQSQPEQPLESVESLVKEEVINNNDNNRVISTEKQDKNEASKTSSKKLKDTFSNIENLLDDLGNHLKAPTRLKSLDSRDGYEGDDEIKYGFRKGRGSIPNPATQFIPGQGPVYRGDFRNSAMPFMEGPISEFENGFGRPNTFNNQNQRSHLFSNNSIRPVSYSNNNINITRKPYYNPNSSMIMEEDDILVEGHSMSQDLMNNRHKLGNPMNEEDEYFDIDQSINNNLRILKDSGMSSPSPTSNVIKNNMAMDRSMHLMNEITSPAISPKALKLVGVENQSISNMSNKALKMLGMNAQSNKANDFANFQFNENELAMLNAAPTSSPHLANRHRTGSNASGNRMQTSEEYMPYSSSNPSKLGQIPNPALSPELDVIPNPALNPNLDMIPNPALNTELDMIPNPALNPNPNMSMDMNMHINRNRINEDIPKFLQEEEILKQSDLFNHDDEDDGEFDIDDLIRDPNMLTMGSTHSNNSSHSLNSNNTYSMNQKAMKVFGISESDLINSNGRINTINSNNMLSPRNKYMNLGASPINSHMTIPSPSFDNLNLSRYSINDGENQINGIISSKALKIIGLNEPPTQMNINVGKNGKRNGEFYDKKGVESSIIKKEKLKEWEEVGEYLRDVMPVLGSLKPIMSDYLFLASHGLVKSWKKRFVILTQDYWIYYFNTNNPKEHARASIPINSNTRVRELMDPFNVVPYFIEIVAQYSNESNERRYITIGCDTKQKCQYWLTSIKSLIARDKFSNAKLPPKPDMDSGSVSSSSSSTNKYRSQLSSVNRGNSPMISPLRNGRGLNVGDLGSLYDDIPGYTSSTNNNDLPMSTISSPTEYQNPPIRKSGKNLRLTKPPARKESFKPRYASMMTSPNMNGFGGMGGVVNAAGIANFNGRTQRVNSPSAQSTIPMISSSPLMKSQIQAYSPYVNNGISSSISPLNKGSSLNDNNLNNLDLTSPNLPPMSLPGIASSPVSKSTPKSIGSGSFKQGESIMNKVPSLSGSLHSPVISPKSKPLTSPINSPITSPYIPINTLSQESFGSKFSNINISNLNTAMLSPTEEDMMSYDFENMNMNINNMNMDFDQAKMIQQQKMQEQLILKQQQQILALQKQLLKNKKEMEQGIMDMSKDKNFY